MKVAALYLMSRSKASGLADKKLPVGSLVSKNDPKAWQDLLVVVNALMFAQVLRINEVQVSKNIPSLHRFVEHAPTGALLMLLQHAPELAEQEWVQNLAARHALQGIEPNAETHRGILEQLQACDDELKMRLEAQTRSIITLSEGFGPKAIGVADDQLHKHDDADQTLRQAFEAQLDDYGRATLLYVHVPALFEVAERYFYSEHHRNYGRVYEAYDVDCEDLTEFNWDEDKGLALESCLRERLGLAGNCLVHYLPFEDRSSDGEKMTAHLFLIRHAGPNSSVRHTGDDLTLKPIFFRPPVEATVLFQPERKQVEVYAHEQSQRYLIASAFVEIGTAQDLSKRPVSLRRYDLSRFYQSLALPQEPAHRLHLMDIRVTEVEARPQNFKRVFHLKVAKDDDIEQAAIDDLGDNHIFRRASQISRVVINLRFEREGKEINLPITLSAPNRCNLASRRDPRDRELGFAVLEAYAISQATAPLDRGGEAQLFHVMLKLYEADVAEVRQTLLKAWGANVDVLLAAGFLTPMGRAPTVMVRSDEGDARELKVRPAGNRMVADDPDTGESFPVDSDDLVRYAVKKEWVLERVVKALRGAMRMNQRPKRDAPIVKLGDLDIGPAEVPVYLARRLDRLEVVAEVDRYLRGLGQVGYGLVLTATAQVPEFLAANVVVRLHDVMTVSEEGLAIDQAALMQALRDGSHPAQAASTVDLRVSSDLAGQEQATLIIPGRDPFPLQGQQVLLVQRLLQAHRDGVLCLQGKDLFEGMGSNHPSQLFKSDVWKTYIGHPPGQKRGWTLLTGPV